MCYFMICECIEFEMCQVKDVDMPYACIVHTHTHKRLEMPCSKFRFAYFINFHKNKSGAMKSTKHLVQRVFLKLNFRIWCQRFSLQYFTLASTSAEMQCSLFN